MANITANLVVNFSNGTEGDDSVLQAEIDSREEGFNSGNTSFTPAQTVYYLVNKTPDVDIVEHLSTAGRIEYVTSITVDQEEALAFAGESEATVRYPIAGAYQSKWLGIVPPANLVLTGPTRFALQDSAGTPHDGLGMLKVNYSTNFDVYRLTGLPAVLSGESDYSVIIYISGETT